MTRIALVALVLTLPACRACRSQAPERAESPSEPADGFRTSREALGRAKPDLPRRESLPLLSLVAPEARMVIGVEMARLRASGQWPQVAGAARRVLERHLPLGDLAVRTGLDPFEQVEEMVLAAPVDSARRDQLALALAAPSFDEARLVSWARDRASLADRVVEQRAEGKHLLWRLSGAEQLTAFFPRRGQLVVGTHGWAERIASAKQPGLAPSAELMRLCERARAGRGIWFAVVLPGEVRQPLFADPRIAAAAAILRLSGGLALQNGLRASLVAELSNSADARALAAQLQRVLPETKRHPQLLLMGLGAYLEAARIEAQGSNVRVSVDLSEAQLKDLLGRAAAMPGSSSSLQRGRWENVTK